MTGMGGEAIAGLAVILIPSFIVSPGLIQKTWAAHSDGAARAAALGNAAALAAFAFVPALLGMGARALIPGLANPELALPALLTDVLPPWLGALGLAALFAAEISTADAVLFMLSTSLAKDLYKAFVAPEADDRRLLAVGRGASVAAGALGVLVAILLPSVVDALRAFYGVLTVALFVPLMVGLFAARPGAAAARGAIVLSVAAWGAALVLRRGAPDAAWSPHVVGILAGLLVMAAGAAGGARRGPVSGPRR
jgi:SSS family solute:Na+ symporter